MTDLSRQQSRQNCCVSVKRSRDKQIGAYSQSKARVDSIYYRLYGQATRKPRRVIYDILGYCVPCPITAAGIGDETGPGARRIARDWRYSLASAI